MDRSSLEHDNINASMGYEQSPSQYNGLSEIYIATEGQFGNTRIKRKRFAQSISPAPDLENQLRNTRTNRKPTPNPRKQSKSSIESSFSFQRKRSQATRRREEERNQGRVSLDLDKAVGPKHARGG